MSELRLTLRDLNVLTYLREQGVATADQLAEEFFPTYDACRARISKLARYGHIESVKLRDHLSAVPSKFRHFSRALGQSPEMRYKMSIYRLGKRYNEIGDRRPEVSTPIFWQHQIYLNDIRAFLKKILPADGIFVSDTELRREWARYKVGSDQPIPDLVWRERGRKREIAFELERTNKGRKPYFRRMIKLDKGRYEKVVYFAASDSIYSTIEKAANAFPKIAVAHSSQPGKVFSRLGGTKSISEFIGV